MMYQLKSSSLPILLLLLTKDISLRCAWLSSRVEIFLDLRLNSRDNLSESAAFRSHQ